jgi:hypothetical protein
MKTTGPSDSVAGPRGEDTEVVEEVEEEEEEEETAGAFLVMTRTCLVGDVRAARACMNNRTKSASGGGGM